MLSDSLIAPCDSAVMSATIPLVDATGRESVTSCERVDDRNGIVRHAIVEILAKESLHASVKTSRQQQAVSM